MNHLKRVMSWLSGVALVLGSLIEAANAWQAASGGAVDPASPIGKGLLFAGTVLLFIRNILKDENANGIPDLFEKLNPTEQRAVMSELKAREHRP